ALRPLRRRGCMGAQINPERCRLGEVLERPHHCRVRRGHLARRTLPGAVTERSWCIDSKAPEASSPLMKTEGERHESYGNAPPRGPEPLARQHHPRFAE